MKRKKKTSHLSERHTCDKALWVVIKGVNFNYIKLTVTSHKLMFEGDEGNGALGSHEVVILYMLQIRKR